MNEPRLPPKAVLDAFGLDAEVEPLSGGLINATFALQDDEGAWILQRVNPIFAPENHWNIRAVTEHLHSRGLPTPRLRETREGQPFRIHEGETWRVMDRIPGEVFGRAPDPDRAREAAHFVARWHEACEDLEHEFTQTRVGVHDTPAHERALREALDAGGEHPLFDDVARLSESLFAALETLEPLPGRQLPVAHGDLKISNLVFQSGSSARPAALIDLDTVAPMLLAHELGDALRSWCNRASEDDPAPRLDLDVARAATSGYLEARGWMQDAEARRALVLGPEWISLELALRFTADALRENYFGWDPTRYPSRGAHNLARARGQWELHRAFAETRSAREANE